MQAPENGEVDEVSEQLEPDEGVAFDHEADEESWTFDEELPAHHDEAPVSDDPGVALEPELEPPALESHAPEPQAPEPGGQQTAVHRPDFLDQEAFEEPDFEPRREDRPAPHPAGDPADFHAGHVPGPDPGEEPEGEGEGLLEETPEFLQDTPDHDRLWFEQRPPRDFDFDG
ncbi:MAG TPA: hypothetical protein VF781_15115 [Solirubrobacteraceae bacterium]